jgi:NAD(P)-dependent dehydrogenase (short-subunit alcohol dehydrogenase family)
MRLGGRHALVTGGGSGIGAAIARALVKEGARVTLVGRRAEALDQTVTHLRSLLAKSRSASSERIDAGVSASLETNGVFSVVADVTDAAAVDHALRTARDANGPVDILVNNAGAAESAPFHKVTLDAWRRAMAVNLDAVFLMTRAALPDLRAAEHGRVITIASTAGLKGYGYTAPYVAAKHGTIGFTRALATEFAKSNLTVNAVCPGFTETEIVARSVETIMAKSGRSEREARAELARFNPQGRLIDPSEVADAVVWLCLPSSRSITGQSLIVAGGEVM